MKGDAAAVGDGGELGADEVLHLVVNLDGVQLRAIGEGFGHGEGRIAGERAYFKHAPGAEHGDEHTEYAPLNVTAHHARVDDVESRLAGDSAQIVRLGVGVRRDVFVNQTVGFVGESVCLFKCHFTSD